MPPGGVRRHSLVCTRPGDEPPVLQVETRPALLAPVALVLALVAGRMSVRYERLAFAAVITGMVGWVVGLTLAVITHHPLL